MTRRLAAVLLLAGLLGLPGGVGAQQVRVEEFVLDNGLRFLLVPRKGDPNVAAGWVARVGSVNERPGITGISHLFEHMMFKGTRVIGTTDIEEDLKLMARMDEVKAKLRVEEQALEGEVVGAVDSVLWPVALDYKLEDVRAWRKGEVVVAFINGSVRSSEQEMWVKLLREKCGLVVATAGAKLRRSIVAVTAVLVVVGVAAILLA